MTAVHDGDGGAAAAGSAAVAPGDSAGIALDAVRDVGGGHGWGCTQALPPQGPAVSQSDATVPDPPAEVSCPECMIAMSRPSKRCAPRL